MSRVTKQRPCPICGRGDWCLLAADDSAAICARISEGSRKRTGEAGWLHILRQDEWPHLPRRRHVRAIIVSGNDPLRMDFGSLAGDYAAEVDPTVYPQKLEDFADSLGLSSLGLVRLRVGWAAEYNAWSFPMADANAHVQGIRLRGLDGRKFAIRGGREGLFLPAGLDCCQRLLVNEGPTDCCALLDLGFESVGRPSCTGGVRPLVELLRLRHPPEVVIVADGDAPGLRGAEALAAVLLAYCPAVRLIRPPEGVKDARAWKLAGATAADIETAIAAAPVRRLRLVRGGA